MPQPSKPRKSSGGTTKRTTSGKKPSGGSGSRKARAKPAPKSEHFTQARTRAARVLQDPEATRELLAAAGKQAEGKRAGKLSKVVNELKAMLRLVKAYATGDYRAVSWESMVLIVAALIYLVSPIDAIPDPLPFGLADDATVILFVVGLVHEELEGFMAWEQSRGDEAAG